MRHVGASVLIGGLLGVCPGCRGGGEPGGHGLVYTSSIDAFGPARLQVHPLTHVDRMQGGAGDAVVLHLELKDRFGDTTKGAGRLAVMLYRPGMGVQPGLETQELKWDVPGFEDAERNSAMFDPATRTYRIQLAAPEWVGTALASTTHGEPNRFTLRAILTLKDEKGQDRFLSDEFVLQK